MLIISGGQLWDQWMGMFSPHMYVWTYSIVLCLKYIIAIGSTDLFISCHVRNNNYELCKAWIFENKISNGYLKIKLQI